MIVKLVKVKEVMKGDYEYMRIVAEKQDGSKYEKDFFKFKKNGDLTELSEKLNGFAVGEFLNLSYDETKYKNLKDIKSADGFPEQKSYSKKGTASGGNSRGDDYNRSSAIYLAKEVVFKCFPDSTDEGEILTEMFTVAGDIMKYISEGVNPSIAGELATPKVKED